MQLRLVIYASLSILLVACAQQQTPPGELPSPTVPESTPTEALTATPTATIAPRSTLPPEWTVAPPTDEAGGDTENDPSAPPTLTAEPPVDLQSPIPASALDEACDSFGPDLDRSQRTYRPGENATVYWYPVEGAEFYSVTLTDESGEAVITGYTEETGYVFEADLFAEGGFYGWEAYPINSVGQQMCLTRGAELFPE